MRQVYTLFQDLWNRFPYFEGWGVGAKSLGVKAGQIDILVLALAYARWCNIYRVLTKLCRYISMNQIHIENDLIYAIKWSSKIALDVNLF